MSNRLGAAMLGAGFLIPLAIAIDALACPAPLDPAWPQGGWFSTSTYDAQSDRVILFGGGDSNGRNDTWAYDYEANSWVRMKPESSPSPRLAHAATYDSKRDRVLLFGGSDKIPGRMASLWDFYQDFWAYDFESDKWTELAPSNPPSELAMSEIAYDAQSDRVILFGGLHEGGGSSSQTWAYDPNNNSWTMMNPPIAPPRRLAFAMAYDQAADRIVIFGGYEDPAEKDDTWAYDYENDRWEDLTNSSRPPRRTTAGMAYDPDAGRILLFGGSNTASPSLGDSWAFDYPSRTWTQVFTNQSPPPISDPTFAYDLGSRKTILFGGTDDRKIDPTAWAGDRRTPVNFTWAYHVATNEWTNLTRAPAPQGLSAAPSELNVTLMWDPVPPASGEVPWRYQVYRGTSAENLTCLPDLAPSATFIDGSGQPNATYYYAVAAVGKAGEGKISAQVNGSPLPRVTPPVVLPSTEQGGFIGNTRGADAVIVIAIVLSFFAGALVNEYGVRRRRDPPDV